MSARGAVDPRCPSRMAWQGRYTRVARPAKRSEQSIALARDREPVAGPDIPARHPGLGAVAAQHADGDGVAVGQRLSTQRCVSGTGEFGRSPCADRDAVPVTPGIRAQSDDPRGGGDQLRSRTSQRTSFPALMTQPTLPLGKLNAVNPSTSRMPGAGLVDGSGVDDAFDCSVPVLFRGPASPPQLHSAPTRTTPAPATRRRSNRCAMALR